VVTGTIFDTLRTHRSRAARRVQRRFALTQASANLGASQLVKLDLTLTKQQFRRLLRLARRAHASARLAVTATNARGHSTTTAFGHRRFGADTLRPHVLVPGALAGFATLIILHEFGHFAVAKRGGYAGGALLAVRRTLLLRFARGETEYGIGPTPLGVT
jgi:hypothetical protein